MTSTLIIVVIINVLLIGWAIYLNMGADNADAKELGAFAVLLAIGVCLVLDFVTGLVLFVLHLLHAHRG